MNICKYCRSGRHENCKGMIFEEIKSKTFILRSNKKIIESSNECECSCQGIINDSTEHFKINLKTDIRETVR